MSKLEVAGWKVLHSVEGFRILGRFDKPKTPRGKKERAYFRIEPTTIGARVTHSLAYPHKARHLRATAEVIRIVKIGT